MDKKLSGRVKELLRTIHGFANENRQLVEKTNEQLKALEKEHSEIQSKARARQFEINNSITSRKGAIHELLRLELGEKASDKDMANRLAEIEKELQEENNKKKKTLKAVKNKK